MDLRIGRRALGAGLLLWLLACAPTAYRTVPMVGYHGEQDGGVWGTPVRYLNTTERAAFEVFVRSAKIVDAQGEPLDSRGEVTIFVMGPGGRIYAAVDPEVGKFHHSSFLAGGDVAAAGELVVRQGVLELVTDRSGHYQPPKSTTTQFLHRLECAGLDLSTFSIFRSGVGSSQAATFLATERRTLELPRCPGAD